MVNREAFRSLEFWLVVATNLAAALAIASDNLSDRYALYTAAGSASFYALARGLAKINGDCRYFWRTTEFWVAVLGATAVAIGGLADTIGPARTAQLLGVIAAASAIANGLRKSPTITVTPTSRRTAPSASPDPR
jgi:hypothetical protein